MKDILKNLNLCFTVSILLFTGSISFHNNYNSRAIVNQNQDFTEAVHNNIFCVFVLCVCDVAILDMSTIMSGYEYEYAGRQSWYYIKTSLFLFDRTKIKDSNR